jgi:hypothetical protein
LTRERRNEGVPKKSVIGNEKRARRRGGGGAGGEYTHMGKRLG